VPEFKVIFTGIIVGLLPVLLFAEELTGRDIMLKVNRQDSIQTEFNRTKMTLINRQGKMREREVIRYEKKYGTGSEFDSKSLIFFEYPADIRGTGLLLWSYQAVDKEDDRWLYLPALKRIRRIAGESKNEYFMGTDFTYDDMGGRNVDDDKHTLLSAEVQDTLKYYKVESEPVDPGNMYSKKIAWIIPDKWMATRLEFYDKKGALLKVLEVSDIRSVDGFWTPHKLHMHNLQENHQTIIEVEEVKFNKVLTEDIFSTNTLQRGRAQ
jgi:outer membrane lipoprotein-sorting protein